MKNIIKNRIFLMISFDMGLIFLTFAAKSISKSMIVNMSDCFFASNGLICPACGGTRSVFNFFEGNFAASFSYNPMVFITAIYFIILLLSANLYYIFNIKLAGKIFKILTGYTAIIILALSFVLVGFLRNFI